MVSRFKSSFPLLLVVLAVLVAFPAAMAFGQDTGTPTATPTIKSDLADYPPGATVTLTGSGWQPGETVDIFVDDDQTKTWVGNFQATADASGNITHRFQLPDWFVATYQVRATGAQSGVATTSFTDAAVDIQGQNKGSATWDNKPLQGWAELEQIPLRLTLTPPSAADSTTYTINVTFNHFKSSDKSPGVQDLYGWTPASGVTLTQPPRLTTSTGDNWVYTLTATVAKGTATPFVEFRGKLAAGAHNFTGNSLAVGVDNGGGNLSIAKPAAATGTPDSAVTKTGPTSAAPGDTLTYTLNYQNKSSTTDATGTQLTDKLPSGVQYVAGSCSGVCTVSGSEVIWDLGTVARGTSGSRTLQVRVPTNAASGTEYLNEALIRSAHVDFNPADNNSALKTTVSVNRSNTNLSVSPTSGTFGGSANLSATLTSGGSGVGGKTVAFTLNGTAVCGGSNTPICPTTNANGVATLSNVNLSGIDAGTYAGIVRASFAGDTGLNSSSGSGDLTVNKAGQTITFGALANKAISDPDFRVSATGGASGNPVTFRSETTSTCTVNGESVHIVGAGICMVTASQAGNGNYQAATDVSQSFSIGKADQTITFAAPTGKTFGDADFDPGATTDSTLAVGYSSSTTGVCTIDSQTNNIHIVSAGTCTVTASQAGNNNYNPAESVTRSFTIAKANQTINFATGTPTTKTVDDPDFQLSATSTSTLTVTFAASPSSTCTVNGESVHIVGAGTCTITATQAGNDNYQAANASHTITVGKSDQRALSVTSPTSGTYGDRLQMAASGGSGTGTVSFTATGSACNIPTSGTDAGKLVITSGTGNCSITATKAGDNNYQSATSAPQQVAISKAELKINADNQTVVYGAANPDLTYKLSGFVNGDTSAAGLAGDAACSVADGTDRNVGTYTGAITCAPGTLSSTNYRFATGTNGNVTITKRPITVTADAKSKTYGEADPALTYKVTSGNVVQGDNLGGNLARAAGESVAGSPYAINQGTLSAGGNYELTFVGANLTIGKAALTVKADDKSREYGAANPNFTGTLTGVKNDDAITANYSSAATASSNVGTYPIVADVSGTQAVLANYDITKTNGTLTVGKAALTVKADDKSKTYGEGDPALTYSVTSGNLVNGDALTGALTRAAGQDVGTYAINQGTLSASNNYQITFVPGTFAITKAALTVTAKDATKVYGANNPAFDVGYSGFVNGDTAASLGGTLSFDTAANAGSPVGTYDVTPKGLTSGNYSITFAKGTLSVTKADLTVTADNKSKVYGAANPNFTVSYDGFVNGDTATALGGTLAFDTNATAASPVGSYDVTPKGLTSGNYSITFAKGTLSVTKADLTVTADNATKVYGSTNPAFTASYSGFKNGDTKASLGGTLAFSTSADQSSSVGTYDVTPSGLTSGNYTINFVKGTLSVTKADLTVKANDATKVYGEANPQFSGTLTGVKNNDAITASYGTTATQQSAVGTYDIVPALNDPNNKLSNYNVTKTNGTLTINKAALTVKADDTTKVYGEANPNFTVSYSGFVNGDTKANLGGTLAFSTSANQSSAVGSYDVMPSGLTSGNYNITFVKGTLTIDKRAIEVTADDKTKTYGENDPALTYKVTGGNLVNGDAFTGSLTRADGQNAGTYAINQGTLSAGGNYTLTFKSGTLTVNKAALTVTADNKSKTYGDANPTLTASYSGFVNGDTQSVLSGSPALNTSATQSSNTGTYAITAAQGTLAANNYSFTFKDGTLTVNKAALTVTADNKSKTYGDANPDFTVSYSGFVNGDTKANLGGTLAFGTQADQSSPVGSYDVTPSGLTSSNYTISFAKGTLSVTKAPLTVTTKDATKVYGSANPTFDVGYSGFVNNEGPTSLSGTLAFDTAATQSSPVGTYDVTPKGLTSSNYTISFVKGTLSVTKATLTVTADNKSKTYGDGNPSLTPSYTGWKNADTASVLTGSPDLSTTATQGSNVGTYDITAAQGTLSANNYSFTFAKGTLTINKADLTVKADDKNKTYGDDNPNFTPSYSGWKNGDTASVLTGSPALSTTATQGSKAGTYAITAAVGTLAADNYKFSFTNGTLTIGKRDATVVYTGQNYATLASAGNATINLSAKVSRTAGGSLGDLSLARVQFTVKKFGGAVQTTVHAMANASGDAATTASVPTSDDPYTVEVQVDPANEYWKSGTDVSSLQVIVGSGTGRTAGGGWIPDDANTINGRANFGFTVANSKTGLRGNHVFIYRRVEGNNQVQYVVKSNSWQGGNLTFNVNNDPTRATFTGRATVQRYVNGVQDTTFSGGNYTFTVDDFDGDLKTTRVTDGYAIVVRDSSNNIVKQLGSRTTPVTMGGGNVLIQAR